MSTAKKSKPITIALKDWIALTVALGASPDISVEALALKARRLVESRNKYARQVLAIRGTCR